MTPVTVPARPTRSRSCATSPARSWGSRTCWSPAPACASRCSPGHGLSINAEFEREISVERARELLEAAPGVTYQDVPSPLKGAGRDGTFVGRLRADQAFAPGHGLQFFAVGDNLRKGAALNAIELAELLAAEIAV